MAGIFDVLGPWLGAIASSQTQNPTPGFGKVAGPPSPGVTAPTATPHYGLMDVLSAPGVEGPLQAWLTLAMQPRAAGWGRGLAAAGAAGLQGFEQARAQQLQYPIQQAQLSRYQAETQKDLAEAAKSGAEQKYYTEHPDALAWKMAPGFQKSQAIMVANAATASRLRAMAGLPTTMPGDRQRLLAAADMVQNATDYIKPEDALKAGFTDPTLVGRKTQAEINKDAAEAQRAAAEAGLVGTRRSEIEAQTDLARQRQKALQGAGPLSAKELDAIDRDARAEADSVIGKPKQPAPPGRLEDYPIVGGSYQRALTQYEDLQRRWTAYYNGAYQRKLAQRQALRNSLGNAAAVGGDTSSAAETDLGTFHPYGEP
jgi:hypothetical protein